MCIRDRRDMIQRQLLSTVADRRLSLALMKRWTRSGAESYEDVPKSHVTISYRYC